MERIKQKVLQEIINQKRKLLQEVAIISFYLNEEAEKTYIPEIDRFIYKIKVDNPWLPMNGRPIKGLHDYVKEQEVPATAQL